MNKITACIPLYNTPEAVLNRLLHTIKSQCECDILAYADGDGKSYTQITEAGGTVIKGKVNSGPGVARQKMLEACKTPYITFIDSDDLLATPLFFENAIRVLDNNPTIAVATYTFLQMNEDNSFIPHERDGIWVFGKVYRVEFLRRYNIHFPDFRANEDTCFNKQCNLLADNDRERIAFFRDVTYYWAYNEASITRIGNGQYGDDQCFCGWILSTTHAIQHVRKYRPFSGSILMDITNTMVQSYFYHVKCIHDHPFFAKQQWYYIKQFYNNVYKEVGKHVSEEALAEVYSVLNAQNGKNLIQVIPAMGIREFFDRLEQEPYDEDEIYTIWAEMYKERPDLLENNVKCGVMPKNYWRRSSDLTIEKKRKRV